MFILLFFAFVAGLVTILAPCIWPLLPIVLSSAALGKGKQRPLGITVGIMVSFALFTLAISSLVKVFHFDANLLRIIAAAIILLLGIVMLIPPLLARLELLVSSLSSRLSPITTAERAGFGGGFFTGLVLGIVWSPCAGPILATIAALSITGQVSWQLVLITVAYVTGVGIPLFLFTYAGHNFITNSRRLSPYTGRIQQFFGIIMILAAVGIYTNYDKLVEAKLLNAFPILSSSLSKIEDIAVVTQELDKLRGGSFISTSTSFVRTDLFNANVPAPEIVGINHWLNVETDIKTIPGVAGNELGPTLQSLRGKVVLVDFWTYTCINCIRTLPHVTRWYETYKDQGFVVLGIHTPEFEFEKNTSNVQYALNQFNIHYPVGQDNDYATWNAYTNRYWPAEYLIDARGTIRRYHFGEGEYDTMEKAIQALLVEAGSAVTTTVHSMPDETPRGFNLSPETYLGSSRSTYYYPDGGTTNGTRTYTLAEQLPTNRFSLGGTWTVAGESITSGEHATLTYRFNASKVFLVLKPGPLMRNGLFERYTVKVFLDGKMIDDINAGTDVSGGTLRVNGGALYNVVHLLNDSVENHVLRLEFETPGIQAFAFTFG